MIGCRILTQPFFFPEDQICLPMWRGILEARNAALIDHTDKNPRGADNSSKLALDRTRLAHERTMLGWVRTATALITFGFSVQQFFRIASAGVPGGKGFLGPHEFGLTMIIIGLLALLLATLDHRSAMQTLRA